MELFKSRTRVAYTNAVGDKVYPVVVDIKKGIKSTEDIQFVSSDVNTGILSVAFISGNENFNVSGADVVCSVMRPDASTLELPCEVVRENIVEVPLGINGTSQDGVYSFDFKVLKGGNKVVGTPIMNYSVSLSIGNDMVVEEDDRLPVLTVLMTQLTELKEETREYINQANTATVASKEATAKAIEATNNANAVGERVSQETATAITRVDNTIVGLNNTVSEKISEIEVAKSDMTNTVSNKVNEVETRFNALTSSQQQSSEVIDARDGETSLKARLDRDIEKAKQVYVNVEGSHISTDSSVGYAKDVEILGNTVQDASNLADIRSVGDKVEGQELYEIPVLSVGKNLFNPNLLNGYGTFVDGVWDTNTLQTDIVIEFYANAGQTLSWTCVRPNTTGSATVAFVHDDDTYTYHAMNNEIGQRVVQKFSKNVVGIRYVKWGTSVAIKDIQLEEGTVATPYEPYQEDKLTILSPVQLEKVGDVADRIIEKDGVWGVEKNVGRELIDTKDSWIQLNLDDVIMFGTQSKYKMSEWFGISNYFLYESSDSNNEHFKYDINTNKIYTYINKSKLKTQNVEGFTEWSVESGYYHIFPNANPQFIPLPHDQQIKLRTFANKTNISFGCEIEGTIKAQVPKSLGATVNTHTEQINNLNKELDRVKKLEESTVSTVTTESDFTTVEATSNGYFEDVKLEGRTLVNLYDISKTKPTYPNTTTIDGNKIKFTSTDNQYFNFVNDDFSKIKPSTTYTIVVDVFKNTLSNNGWDRIFISSEGSTLNDVFSDNSVFVLGGQTGRFVFKVTSKANFDGCTTLFRSFFDNGALLVGAEVELSIILLEGDHTQNPPSFFEGLKSVGQSASEDGADEIVVSSVNENLFDKNQTLTNGYISMRGDYGFGVVVPSDECRATDFIRVDSNITYTLNNDNAIDETCGFYDATKKCITVVKGNTVTSPSNAKYKFSDLFAK